MVCAIRLVKNLWFFYTGKPIEKGIRTTSHKQNQLLIRKHSLNFIPLLRVVITRSVTTLLRGENDSKQLDEFQAIEKNDFRKAKKQNKLLTQPFLLLKTVGFHILLQSITIRYCISFKSYKVHSWKAVYISRRCQIAEKDNNCVNFWCRKSLGKLNHVPTSNKTDSFSILVLFYVKLKFLNERNCFKKRSLIKIWYKIGCCRL